MYERRERNLNIRARSVLDMNLEGIIKDLQSSDVSKFELNQDFHTIRYISDIEYSKVVGKYIEPEFKESVGTEGCKPRFILFSAPGATGKTALALHISHIKGGVYWDLPDSKVAEYSLQGAIQNAVGTENLSLFYKSIKNGDIFLVIDAFDEAEAGSGRTGIEFFLRDLNTVTKGCEHVCAILMARTESALFIKNYLMENNMPFVHYEVGLFSTENAVEYIKSKLETSGVTFTEVVSQCIRSQFDEVNRIFNEDARTFIGYAPVLDALARAYDGQRNTLALLQQTLAGTNSYKLISSILSTLISREHGKFEKAASSRLSDLVGSGTLKELYMEEEQLSRVVNKILFDEVENAIPVPNIVPIKYKDDYLGLMAAQVPQHPFIGSDNDFVGAAFRDYTLAYFLSNSELRDLAEWYLEEHVKYCPSQMLIEFYAGFSGNKIYGKDVSLMYDSFKACIQLGDKFTMSISGDVDDCKVVFTLIRDGKEKSLELELVDANKGIFLSQIVNCYIDVPTLLCVGKAGKITRISNSTIICNTLEWCSESFLIDAFSQDECVICADKFERKGSPKFEVRTDEEDNLRISASNIKEYFRLLPYAADEVSEFNASEYLTFCNFIRRLFTSLRSHSKDTPARKMDFVDNRIISTNQAKMKYMKYLLNEGIIYTDNQDWLYKLDTGKVSELDLNFVGIAMGDFSSLQTLYTNYSSN